MNAVTEHLAALAADSGLTIAVAESLTAGNLAAALGAAPDSGAWFRGGIVAYSATVKHDLLKVPPGPVVSEPAARAMADNTRTLLDATLVVAVTGAGGPDSQDGEPPGSVWFAISTPDGTSATHRQFDGEPGEVLDQTVTLALDLLLEAAKTHA
ncbi:CinA family protein [Nocardia goodfellowii]|uniref:Nicotinamide-nucleotide amidase n=1 Tax=Nocardia goodfellowii TaxID=882446 RepID=A0ABS4QQL5_9NOCA|nr:CinA family protein [Nocardia goodfellowii]MBP2193403.1 nicotinamide-nucleotide amidase [Nocardia goodfellowii]